MASARPETESWSVTASTRTPCRAASFTSSRGDSVPSDAVVCACRSTPPGTLLPGVAQVGQDRAHRAAGGALGTQRRVLLDEGRPRDVEVAPRPLAGELLQEQAGGDGAAAAGAHVVHVGHVALEVLAVLV